MKANILNENGSYTEVSFITEVDSDGNLRIGYENINYPSSNSTGTINITEHERNMTFICIKAGYDHDTIEKCLEKELASFEKICNILRVQLAKFAVDYSGKTM